MDFLANLILLLVALAAIAAVLGVIGVADAIAWRFASYRAFIRRLSE